MFSQSLEVIKLNSGDGYILGIELGAAWQVACAAVGDSQSNDDLLQRLNAAEARIAEHEAKNNNGWISEQRAEEMRNLPHGFPRAAIAQRQQTPAIQHTQ